jgi:hypothetical protein
LRAKDQRTSAGDGLGEEEGLEWLEWLEGQKKKIA